MYYQWFIFCQVISFKFSDIRNWLLCRPEAASLSLCQLWLPRAGWTSARAFGKLVCFFPWAHNSSSLCFCSAWDLTVISTSLGSSAANTAPPLGGWDSCLLILGTSSHLTSACTLSHTYTFLAFWSLKNHPCNTILWNYLVLSFFICEISQIWVLPEELVYVCVRYMTPMEPAIVSYSYFTNLFCKSGLKLLIILSICFLSFLSRCFLLFWFSV